MFKLSAALAVCTCWICLVTSSLSAQTPANLLQGGDFEAADASGWAQGWYRVPGGDVQRLEEQGNHFARLAAPQGGGSAVMQRELKRDPAWKAVKLSARVRYTGVRAGKKGWNDARIHIINLDAKGKPVGPTVALDWSGSSKGWIPQEQTAAVHADAVKVKIQVILLDVAAGQFDVDDLSLIPVEAAPSPAPAPTPAPAARTAEPTVPAAAASAPSAQPLPYKALDSNFKGAQVQGKEVAGWYILNGQPEVVQEKDRSFLRLQATDAQRTVQIRRMVPLHPDWGKLTLTARLRHKNIRHGEKNWQNARIIVEFIDQQGKRLSAPAAMDWKGTSKGGWIEESLDYVIPFGAARLKLDPALLEVESGTLELDTLTVTITESRSQQANTDLLPEAWKPALVPHWREKTATREQICLNGVWQIRPIGIASGDPKQVTAGMVQNPPLPSPMPKGLDWGYGKVPSTFPGSKENAHQWALPPAWAAVNWSAVDAVWLRRTIDVPADWAGRRILLQAESVQSQAAVFIQDKLVGRLVFPGGSLDLTSTLTPGSSVPLTLLVIAKPFQEQRVQAMNPNEIYLESAELKQRGLCGDVFLRSEPQAARIEDLQLRPSVREGKLSLAMRTAGATGRPVRVKILAAFDGKTEKEWTSDSLPIAPDGSLLCALPWQAEHLWDIDTPNLYRILVSICDEGGQTLDQVQQRLGFREIWLDGRDIMLNGSPIHWRATKIGNNYAGRSKPQMAGTFKRMRELGFNCAILDYDIYAGAAPSYQPMYDAADEAGVILIATIPAVMPWKSEELPDADSMKRWQSLTDYCIEQAQAHPSVLAYATNHNRLGYTGGSNPEKFDGRHEPRSPEPFFAQKRKLAADAEAYIRSKDPTREIYHHSGNNIGAWETNNCYLNWMPLQERRDYLSHWAAEGVKPLFLTEFGLPFVASWGRYKGPGVYRSTADSEPLFIEYAAALTGARAYDLNPTHDLYVDQYEASYAKSGVSTWAVLTNPWMRRSTEWNYIEIQARHVLETFPAMRTWGISAILPWDWKGVACWTDKTPAKVTLTEPAEEWTTPGSHPDFAPGYGYGNEETWFSSPAADTFKLTSLADAYRKVNRDVLAWIAGRPEKFTEQTHLFQPGQKITRQVVIINDLRRALQARYDLKVILGDRTLLASTGQVSVLPGRQQRDPFEFAIPAGVQGDGLIQLTLTLPDGATQSDEFAFRVLPPVPAIPAPQAIAIWDPAGDTSAAIKRLGVSIPAAPASLGSDLRCLIVGRGALTVDGPAPDIRPLLQRGGRVVVFEQSNAVLTQRLGFRTAIPSLRNAFVRAATHPLLDGLDDNALHDWNGEATLITPKLSGLPEFEAKYPTTDWLGFRNTRVWKWGNWGQVASVVIEKPQTGDFLTLVDGGFDLQYAPLLLARQGGGEILFCQFDVSGRSQPDPAADRLVANILRWAAAPAPAAAAAAFFVGDAKTQQFLQSLGAGLTPASLPTRPVAEATTWIIAPGLTSGQLKEALPAIEKSRGTFLFLFQPADVLAAFEPYLKVAPVKMVGDVLPAHVPPAFTGVGPAELHLRARTLIPGVLPAKGWNTSLGSLAAMDFGAARLVFVQVDPRQFDYTQRAHAYVKLTHNHSRTLLARTLSNCGVPMASPLADYWVRPAIRGDVDLTRAKWHAAIEPDGKLTPEQVMASPNQLSWREVTVPGALDLAGQSPLQGRFWYRLTFDVPAELLQEDLQLACGIVDDEDNTYLNGKLVGHIGKDTHPRDYYRQLRQYRVPRELLKPTGNILLIQGNNIEGPGGILEGPVRLAPFQVRWKASFYQDTPVAVDDPYRYYRW